MYQILIGDLNFKSGFVNYHIYDTKIDTMNFISI